MKAKDLKLKRSLSRKPIEPHKPALNDFAKDDPRVKCDVKSFNTFLDALNWFWEKPSK